MCEHFGQEQRAKSVVTVNTSAGQRKIIQARPQMMLSINRKGRFTLPINARRTGSQCGAEGATQYEYQVKIEASNSGLTDDGYVMEIQYIDDYFQEEYTRNANPEGVSCEDMAQRAVEHFIARFKADMELDNVDVRKIYVKVSGSDISFVDAEWEGEIDRD